MLTKGSRLRQSKKAAADEVRQQTVANSIAADAKENGNSMLGRQLSEKGGGGVAVDDGGTTEPATRHSLRQKFRSKRFGSPISKLFERKKRGTQKESNARMNGKQNDDQELYIEHEVDVKSVVENHGKRVKSLDRAAAKTDGSVIGDSDESSSSTSKKLPSRHSERVHVPTKRFGTSFSLIFMKKKRGRKVKEPIETTALSLKRARPSVTIPGRMIPNPPGRPATIPRRSITPEEVVPVRRVFRPPDKVPEARRSSSLHMNDSLPNVNFNRAEVTTKARPLLLTVAGAMPNPLKKRRGRKSGRKAVRMKAEVVDERLSRSPSPLEEEDFVVEELQHTAQVFREALKEMKVDKVREASEDLFKAIAGCERQNEKMRKKNQGLRRIIKRLRAAGEDQGEVNKRRQRDVLLEQKVRAEIRAEIQEKTINEQTETIEKLRKANGELTEREEAMHKSLNYWKRVAGGAGVVSRTDRGGPSFPGAAPYFASVPTTSSGVVADVEMEVDSGRLQTLHTVKQSGAADGADNFYQVPLPPMEHDGAFEESHFDKNHLQWGNDSWMLSC